MLENTFFIFFLDENSVTFYIPRVYANYQTNV